MTEVQCEYPNCEVMFDPDVIGITVTTIEGGETHTHHYCCLAHRPE